MKNKFNYLLKALFIFISLIFLGCETQEEVIKNSNGITVETVNINTLANKPSDLLKFHTKIKKKHDKKEQGRFVYDSINNFYIDEEYVKHAQEGLKESFTFSVKRDNHDKIENILLNKNEDGSFSTYFVKYDFTAEELKTLTQQQIISKDVEIKPIDFDENGLMRYTMAGAGGVICIESWAQVPIVGQEGELTGTNSIHLEWAMTSSYCQWVYSDGGSEGGSNTGTTEPHNDSNTGSGYGPGYGSGNTGSGNLGIFTVINPVSLVQQQIKDFKDSLTNEQRDYLFPTPTIDNIQECAEKNEIWNSLIKYRKKHSFSEESKALAEEIIDLSIDETNQEDVKNLVNLTFLIEDSGDNLFTEEFAQQLFTNVNIDNGILPLDFPISHLTIKTFITYKKLRQLNPEWSRGKCIWYATKEIVHISLDAFGLVPVFGEVADLTNGALYLIEGDNLNASLSVASAVPVAGWATASVKYAVKVEEISTTAYTISTKVKLVWKVTGDVISFGSRNKLRKVLGLLPGNPLQAHHLIPWSSQTKMAVQKAAKYGSAFHMNEALNGIAVAAWRNQPNHNIYNNVINSKLDAFRDLNPNATPQECYEFITDLIQDIRTWVINNPSSHLNNIVLP